MSIVRRSGWNSNATTGCPWRSPWRRERDLGLRRHGAKTSVKAIAKMAAVTLLLVSHLRKYQNKKLKQAGDFEAGHTGNAACESFHLVGEFVVDAARRFVDCCADQVLQHFLIL